MRISPEEPREFAYSHNLNRSVLVSILIAAFCVRVGVRIGSGEANFWKNSYSGYYDLAQNLVSGKGLCFETTCAWWPPLYPLFLAFSSLGGKHYLLIVIPQAVIGAGTAFLAYKIGAQMFGLRVAILAS